MEDLTRFRSGWSWKALSEKPGTKSRWARSKGVERRIGSNESPSMEDQLNRPVPIPVPGIPIVYGKSDYTSPLLCSCEPLYSIRLGPGDQTPSKLWSLQKCPFETGFF